MESNRKHSIPALVALLLWVLAPAEVERIRTLCADRSTLEVECVHSLYPTLELELKLKLAPPAKARTNSGAAVRPAPGTLIVDEYFYPASWTGAGAFQPLVYPPALLPQASAIDALLLTQVASRSAESRGPPPPRVLLASLPPRAPPAA